MKKIIILAAATFLAATALVSCKEGEHAANEDDRVPVTFSANIGNLIALQTRAADNVWGLNDSLGVFMVIHDSPTISENMSNKLHVADGSGVLTATGTNRIYYPIQAAFVDFIAYYPYNAGYDLASYINVTILEEQAAENQPTFDLLWAKANNGGDGYTRLVDEGQDVTLAFAHKLAKIVINTNLIDFDEGTTISSLVIEGTYGRAQFNLAAGTFVADSYETILDIVPRSDIANQYSAIVIPSDYASTLKITLTINNQNYTFTPNVKNIQSGYVYTYNVDITHENVRFITSITNWTSQDVETGDAEIVTQ